VTKTGRATRFGDVARLLAEVEMSQTPLQRRVGRLVKRLSLLAMGVACAVLLLGVLRGQSWPQAFIGAISIAMAAVPEEFPLVFTLFLSVGAFRLGRRGMLVRRLASVETLGSTTVICTDKTGTLTRGEFLLDQMTTMGTGVAEQDCVEMAVLACEPHPTDAMDRAIVAYAASRGARIPEIYARWSLDFDYDFDPVGKHMSHVWSSNGVARIVAKGALEGILAHCAIEDGARADAEARNAQLAERGMRVLALASRTLPGSDGKREEDERGLDLVALLGFRDPLRPSARAAISDCVSAGIAVKMITGDHALTAHAIADEAGIPHLPDGIVTGADLDRLDDAAKIECIRRVSIFARIDPSQKYAIVEALKKMGEIVAMTGDGINDAPALRLANIGVSMGRHATEVARAAADLVLLNDDFASIVETIREGRHIYRNIQTAFLYIIAFHVPIVALALLVPLLGMPLLLQPIHLVWLELVVHPISALVFQSDSALPGVMRQPPRNPRSPMLPRGAVVASVPLRCASHGGFAHSLYDASVIERGVRPCRGDCGASHRLHGTRLDRAKGARSGQHLTRLQEPHVVGRVAHRRCKLPCRQLLRTAGARVPRHQDRTVRLAVGRSARRRSGGLAARGDAAEARQTSSTVSEILCILLRIKQLTELVRATRSAPWFAR
jgi:Ca2+-transporting ATPase